MSTPSEEGHHFDNPFADDDDVDDDVLAPPVSVPNVRAVNSQIRLAKYIQEFDAAAGLDSLILCTLPSNTVDDGSRAQLLAAGIEKEDDAMRHKNDLMHIDELKRNRLKELELQRRSRRSNFSSQLQAIEKLRQSTNDLLKQYYEHAERELTIHLTSRQGEVAQSIGEIRRFNRGEYDPDVPDWGQQEQSVEIHVCKIRGLKDKIPKGKYVVLVSKWDKLAGTPLRWNHRNVMDKPPPPCPLHPITTSASIRKTCEVCTGWAGCSMPIQFDADPRTIEAKFESKIFTFFFPQIRIRPYNALLFELVHIPDESKCLRIKATTGQEARPIVVGWSAIPIVDSQFLVINGRFRFPMMRGLFTDRFMHYETIQRDINESLENWLGNVYVEIFPHAREHFGRNEFQLQSEFTMKLLDLMKYPSSKDPEGWPSDGRKRGASIDQDAGVGNITLGGVDLGMRDAAGPGGLFDDEFPYVRPENPPEEDTPALTRWGIIRIAVRDKYIQHKRKLQEQQREAIRRLEQQKQFRYSIHPHGATTFQSVWRVQVEYCMRAILDELSLRDPLSLKFWVNIFVIILMFFLQLYIHSIFLFVGLYALGSYVPRVVPSYRGLLIDYDHRTQTPLNELMFVAAVQLSNYTILLLLIGFGWAFKKGTGSIPEQLSRFVFTAAISGYLIPIFDIIVDGITGDHRSDFFRLLDFMAAHNYGQYFTVIIFALVYGCYVAGCTVSVFLFTMALHLNGILQDAYWRIMIVNEDTCHIPEDLEVSIVELEHILRNAERWRGANGERRKVRIEKIYTTDEHELTFQQVDLHITIHQINCGNAEEWLSHRQTTVFREFYVLDQTKEEDEPNCALLEAVDDASRPGGISVALFKAQKTKAQKSWEGMMGFAKSVRNPDDPFSAPSLGQSESASAFFAPSPRRRAKVDFL